MRRGVLADIELAAARRHLRPDAERRPAVAVESAIDGAEIHRPAVEHRLAERGADRSLIAGIEVADRRRGVLRGEKAIGQVEVVENRGRVRGVEFRVRAGHAKRRAVGHLEARVDHLHVRSRHRSPSNTESRVALQTCARRHVHLQTARGRLAQSSTQCHFGILLRRDPHCAVGRGVPRDRSADVHAVQRKQRPLRRAQLAGGDGRVCEVARRNVQSSHDLAVAAVERNQIRPRRVRAEVQDGQAQMRVRVHVYL